MNSSAIREAILQGNTVLGIELGSTRIKAVLIDENHTPVASGAFDWENRLDNGVWTYSIDDVWTGLRSCYARLAEDVQSRYGAALTTVGAIGVSGMMHGYMPFDGEGRLLTPFRTWRNTMTAQAAGELTGLFRFNIPQRWSIAHLRQAMLNGEAHVPHIRFLTTLAGYVHWQLTGEKVLGVGEASGMFPIDSDSNDYHAGMMASFNALIEPAGLPWNLSDILPRVLSAGEAAGRLTEAGARLLDPSGQLRPGIPMCPPEGDAGTGMTATNSIAVRTGNVSAGTSVFAMVVLENALKQVHPEIDMVTTPAGHPVAMVHCNNCSTDLNAWVNLFGEFASLMGLDVSPEILYGSLFSHSLKGDRDCGGLVSCNYHSGEHITGFEKGRPLFAYSPESRFNLANFMRTHLYSSLASLKLGLNILLDEEQVCIDRMYAHGGLFRTKGVVQSYLAAAIKAPVTVMKTAGEGGPWGVALLAAYMLRRTGSESLSDYLSRRVFGDDAGETLAPDPLDVQGFDEFIARYARALPIERAAVDAL